MPKTLNVQKLLKGTVYEEKAPAIAEHIRRAGMDNDFNIHDIPTLQTVGGQPAILVLNTILEQMERGEVDATEAAQSLAAEHDIDLASVAGTGVDGTILKSDVENLISEEE